MRHHKNNVTSVASIAALWAIAWAGTKPFASVLDGWLASHVGVFVATEILVMPAILIALLELTLPQRSKTWITAMIHKSVRSRATEEVPTGPPIQLHDITQVP